MNSILNFYLNIGSYNMISSDKVKLNNFLLWEIYHCASDLHNNHTSQIYKYSYFL